MRVHRHVQLPRALRQLCQNRRILLACLTRALHLHGFHQNAGPFGALSGYGSDAPAIQDLMRVDRTLAEPLHAALPYTGAEVVWAVRQEMARTIEDVLARRCRALFLNAAAAVQMVPAVATLMAAELGWDPARIERETADVLAVAKGYQIESAAVR